MDDRPFTPAQPIHLGDEQERVVAAVRRMHRRRAVRAGLSLVVVAVAAAVSVPLLLPGSSTAKVAVDGDPACAAVGGSPGSGPVTCPTAAALRVPGIASTIPTGTSLPARTIPVTTVPAITVPAIPVTTVPAITVPATTVPVTTTRPSSSDISGTVTGPDGRPLPGAYVIGLKNLAVTRTGADGHYSTPCVEQKLVAANWLLPVASPTPGASGGWAYGTDTTSYDAPPTVAGPGYQFSGGTSDLQTATTVACDGQPVNFQLGSGAAVNIAWKSASGATTSTTASPLPVDNLYLPGLGQQAALETAPVASNGQQVIDQLGPGTLRIDGVSTPFSCAGAGVGGDGAVWTVPVAAGQTTFVTCTTS